MSLLVYPSLLETGVEKYGLRLVAHAASRECQSPFISSLRMGEAGDQFWIWAKMAMG